MNIMLDTSYTFIFMGPQGSGKGTQRELLEKYAQEHFDAPHVSFNTGQSFRDFFAAGDGYAQNRIKEIINAGSLLQDFMPNHFFEKAMISDFKKPGFLFLDGYPRSIGQAQNLEQVLAFFKQDANIFVIFIDVNEQTSIDRMMSRGREDDTEESIKTSSYGLFQSIRYVQRARD
jgi:adenylate kinase